jgi:hypothetical protein
MPVNGFSVGRDVVLDIVGPSGVLVFNLITGFNSRPDLNEQKVKGLDGLVRPVIFHDGWSGSFDIERQDSQLDDYWAQLEANYFAGINSGSITITETITEVAGNTTQYRYEGVQLKLADAGDAKGDQVVKQRLDFMAGRRIKVQ